MRGKGHGKQVMKVLPVTLNSLNDENLCEMSVCQDNAWAILSTEEGCGGRPITTTRYT